MKKIQKVCVVGGTHGNELTGVYLVKHWQQQPHLLARPGLEVSTLLANEQAINGNIRYIDQDLNRQFAEGSLDVAADYYEAERAHEINALLGPKSNTKTAACDFIIDLHTTTTNMGLTLVVNQHQALQLKMAAYIQQQMPEAKIFYEDRCRQDDNFLMSVANFSGLLIEVGAVPQGVLRHDCYQLTRDACMHALDFLQHNNQQTLPALPSHIQVFKFVEKLSFKQQNGQLACMIHPNLQDADFNALDHGDPMFIDLDGNNIEFCAPNPELTYYPVFINEAAYYDQLHALSLMVKQTVELPTS